MNIGDRFGYWIVIGPLPVTARSLVHCRCDCGTEGDINAYNLLRGLSGSCGCRRKQVNRARRQDADQRFWPHVGKCGPVPPARPELGPCWEWAGSVDEKGYGRFWDGERQRKAHGYAYEVTCGPVPEGLELDHLCRNPPCVNPAHLDPVTHRENVMRGRSPVADYARSEVCSSGHTLPEPGPDGRRVCRECANVRNRAYKERQRRQMAPREPKPAVHGRSYYTRHGCRCDVCRDAENSYKRQWRKDQKADGAIFDAVMSR